MNVVESTENVAPVTEEAPAPRVYHVVDIDRAREKFAKLAKRAAKLKVAAPGFEVVGTFLEYQYIHMTDHEDVFAWSKSKRPRATGAVRTVHEVVLTGVSVVKLAGWTFVATLDHELGDDNTVVRSVPGTQLPSDWKHKNQYCDHCRRAQVRKQTYVVQHEDGRLQQVGSTCVKDFLGSHAVKALYEVELAGLAQEALEDGFSGGAPTAWDLTEYLAWVAKDIRENGWTSRKAAQDGGYATADRAMDAMREFQRQQSGR